MITPMKIVGTIYVISFESDDFLFLIQVPFLYLMTLEHKAKFKCPLMTRDGQTLVLRDFFTSQKYS